MAYKMTVHKGDGTKEVTTGGGNGKRIVTVEEDRKTYGGIISKEAKARRKVQYNFGPQFGGSLSKKEREDDINRGLGRLRSEYRHSGGMSKGKTMKHVASIPPEIWYSHVAENGPGVMQDPKEVKKLISDWGLKLSPRRR